MFLIGLCGLVVYYLWDSYIFRLVFTGIVVFITAYLWKIKKSYNFFKQRGIQTPKYRYFYGNWKDVLEYGNLSDILAKWTKEYGKLYGYYEGHKPVFVTTDFKIIEEVFIKQFSNFSMRKPEFIEPHENSKFITLFNASSTRWKRLRTIMNPVFSTGKLREVNYSIVKCADRLLIKLNENEKSEINISKFFKRFTMDTIWNVAYGIDTEIQEGKQNDYFDQSEQIFKVASNPKHPILLFAKYFHEIRGYMMIIVIIIFKIVSLLNPLQKEFSYSWIRNRLIDVVDKRKNDKLVSKKRDFVQLLMEAECSDTEFADFQSEKNVDLSSLHNVKKMSTQEIKGNLVTFLLAGYETTSNVLSSCCHCFAKYPEEQQKVFNEINEYFPSNSNEEPNVDNIQDLVYTDLFIKEVLRLFPIAVNISRECTNSTNVFELDIPKGVALRVDVLSINKDPEVWGEDVHEFNPLRFLPEIKRSPAAYLGFGIGPKNCIGMKLALLELKIALVKIVRKFEIEKGPNTRDNLELVEGLVLSPKDGINVVVVKRK